MYSVNVPKVKGKMGELGYSITSLSKKMNINRNTLSNYLENPDNIPYEKLSLMADLLCDNSNEAHEIFFACDLRKTKE